MTELVLCGEPSPILNTLPCPREHGHDGEHYCWGEGRIDHRRYGITVLTFEGERVYHFTMEGQTTADELCALLAFFELVAVERDAVKDLPRCTCPHGFGAVRDANCPRHNPRPPHTIAGA